jgi:hypothetical protein
MTLEEPWQFADTQEPVRSTWLELEHARQLLGPGPEQLEQLAWQVWHEEEVWSKYCDRLQVERHLPLERTGRSGGQREHSLNEGPVQLAQSGWHVTQDPDALNVLAGQVLTQFPLEAN